MANWTENAAINKADASGKMTNTLAIRDRQGEGALPRQRHGSERSAVGDVDADGIAGLRVNHNLNVHIDGFTTKGTKTATQK